MPRSSLCGSIGPSVDFREVAAEERIAAENLARDAALGADGAFMPVLATAAKLAVAAAVERDPTAAIRKLRTDSALLGAIDKTAIAAQRQAYGAIVGAIQEGYLDDASMRSKAVAASGKGISFAVEMTASDKKRLAVYPILGHLASEVSGYLVQQLRYALDGALGQPLIGKIDPRVIPSALGEVAAAHSTRVGNAVREAYFAGTQAAMRELGQALVGGVA
jgi:hypothetical protein